MADGVPGLCCIGSSDFGVDSVYRDLRRRTTHNFTREVPGLPQGVFGAHSDLSCARNARLYRGLIRLGGMERPQPSGCLDSSPMGLVEEGDDPLRFGQIRRKVNGTWEMNCRIDHKLAGNSEAFTNSAPPPVLAPRLGGASASLNILMMLTSSLERFCADSDLCRQALSSALSSEPS